MGSILFLIVVVVQPVHRQESLTCPVATPAICCSPLHSAILWLNQLAALVSFIQVVWMEPHLFQPGSTASDRTHRHCISFQTPPQKRGSRDRVSPYPTPLPHPPLPLYVCRRPLSISWLISSTPWDWEDVAAPYFTLEKQFCSAAGRETLWVPRAFGENCRGWAKARVLLRHGDDKRTCLHQAPASHADDLLFLLLLLTPEHSLGQAAQNRRRLKEHHLQMSPSRGRLSLARARAPTSTRRWWKQRDCHNVVGCVAINRKLKSIIYCP